MIGHGKELQGLYYLGTGSGNGNHASHSHFSEKVSSNKVHVWFPHLRSRHHPFALLKIMFPLLFEHLNINELHCEVCQLANYNRILFPLSDNSTSSPFQLIHSDA